MKIKRIKKIEKPDKVYNLRIKSDDGNNHSYIANDIAVSNCHQTKTSSIKNIIGKCKDSEYRFGLSGTVQEDTSADFTTIVALLGPMVKSIPPRYLFKEGYATPVKFKMMILQYKNMELREKLYDVRRGKQMEGSQILALEKNVVVQHKGRFNFITDLINKTSKNTLVLFSISQLYEIPYLKEFGIWNILGLALLKGVLEGNTKIELEKRKIGIQGEGVSEEQITKDIAVYFVNRMIMIAASVGIAHLIYWIYL